jgi:hypothetical protein
MMVDIKITNMETPLMEAELHKWPLQKQMRAISPWYVPIAHLSWLSGTGVSRHRLKRKKICNHVPQAWY